MPYVFVLIKQFFSIAVIHQMKKAMSGTALHSFVAAIDELSFCQQWQKQKLHQKDTFVTPQPSKQLQGKDNGSRV